VLSDLFFDYLDLVAHLKPKVAIAENVKGMILGNAKGYTKLVMQRFREIGYRPQLFLLNSADCGVPQRRQRVFFCALRNDIQKPMLKLAPKHRWIGPAEACQDIQFLTSEEQNDTKHKTKTDIIWCRKTQPREQYADAVVRSGVKEKLWNHKKLHPVIPSNSLTATHEMINHWACARTLTFREWKRLGSFPDDYQAKSDKIGKYMIGMSVPPKMTEVVARAVVEQWLQ
jgi:DNA (cytosine-5)-methyltransferase 1